MKFLSTISFIILIGLISLTQTTLSQDCIEFGRPLYRYEVLRVPCPMITANDKRQAPTTTPDNMFVVDFTCSVSDATLCDKVKNVFVTAGKYITATLNLKSPVSVKAQFIDFCTNFQDCDTTRVILGAAGPARLLPFQDPTDGKFRLVPQALYKQMDLPEHPQFGPNEIRAIFNANMTYWFEGDPLPMRGRQADMLYVVLHELIHGLGFINSWNDYMGIQALTPFIAGVMSSSQAPGTPAAPPDPIGLPQSTKGQFLELVYDRNLVLLQTGQPLTSITDELNKFPIDLSLSDDVIITSFIKSPQFPIAKAMYQAATTPLAIGFLLKPGIPPNTPLTQDQINNDVLIVETSLVPFVSSSSIGHVDFRTYLNSSDFLMLFTYPPGKTLGDMLTSAGTTNTFGPLGPKLRTLLGIMGYEVKADYTPPVLTNGLQSNGTDGTNKPATSKNNAKNSSSIVSFNLVLSLVCILLANYFRY